MCKFQTPNVPQGATADERRAIMFNALSNLDLSDKCEKRENLTYLSWANAWAEFKKVHPNATYEIKKFEGGIPYAYDPNTGYMVYTSVTVDGQTHEMWLPVMDGANKAMKAVDYTYKTRFGEKTCEAMTMFDVNKTVMRCLVKNLAMFGLGLYIYAGEDLPQDIREYVCADCGKAVESAMAQRTHKAFGAYLCKECGVERSKKKEEAKNDVK